MNAVTKQNAPLPDMELVAMLASLMALQAIGIDTMLPALPEIAHELGAADPNDRQLVLGTYLFGMALGSLFCGFLADRFGRKPVLYTAIGAYVLFSFACMIVPSFDVMLVLRFANGFASAGAGIIATTVVRDRYEGDRMARTSSMIAMIFMVIPVFAPMLGQVVMLVAGWRAIFGVMAALALIMLLWSAIRLPETLRPEDRQHLELRRIAHNFRLVLTNRDAIGYVFGAALVFSGLYGFLNSSQQLIAEHFGQGERFPIIFGTIAASMGVTNFVNSRIVERFGARPVSHTALLAFVCTGAMQLAVASWFPDELFLFLPLMAINMALIGFLGANFGAISLQPFARIAGSASSLQISLRMGIGTLLGGLIGAAYDGTARPLGFALFALSAIGLLGVLYSERGRLFQRRSAEIESV